MSKQSTRGVLHPHEMAAQRTFAHYEPAPDIAFFVERHWTARWNLGTQYAQEMLPCPCVNLVIGTHLAGVYGVSSRRLVARLEGAGWVVGTRFRPGGFRPFVRTRITELTDRTLALGEIFGADAFALEREVHDAPDDCARLSLVETFLRARMPALDHNAQVVARVVELARREPAVTQVRDLATRAAVSVSALERLFREYVGISPKQVLRRFRVQEAAERVAAGAAVDWAALAHECGYFDQAHLIHDFKSQVGETPGQYAARCAQSGR